MMKSFLLIIACLSAVFGKTILYKGMDAIDAGMSCIGISQLRCTATRESTGECRAWRSKKPSEITGRYLKRSGGYYKKVNDINCVDMAEMVPMFFKNSGGTYGNWWMGKTVGVSARSAPFKNCKEVKSGTVFRRVACDNGVYLSIREIDADKCDTDWASTPDTSSVMVKSGSGFPMLQDPNLDIMFDDDFVEKEPQSPMEEEPVDDMPEEPEYPFDSQPVFAEPATLTDPNSYTFTVGPNTLMIAGLVMTNIALIMAILYCREKKRNEKLMEDFQ